MDALKIAGGGCIFAVNKWQYAELMRLEWQSFISDSSTVQFIEWVSDRLKVVARLRRNYVIS